MQNGKPQQWPGNLQDGYYTANPKAARTFIGRCWIFGYDISDGMHTKLC